MKTKAIATVMTVLFLTGLIVCLGSLNMAGAKEPSERFKGYNLERGKWTTGNLGKAYVEGDFVSYMLRMDTASKVWGATEFSVSFNFHQSSSGAIYVDGFDTSEATGFQYSTGEFLSDGIETPPPSWGTHIPTPDAGEPWTSGPKIINYMDAWPPGTVDDGGSVPSEQRYFTVYGMPWTGDHVILFFRAHLALDIIWSAGLEQSLPTVLDGDEFETWTAAWNGASFATGSSRHFFLQYPGIGGKTIPIPIAQYPSTVIYGYKYVGDDPFDGWMITLHGELSLDSMPPIPYDPDPVYTGMGDWDTGYFEFTGLIEGSYRVEEEDRSGYDHVDIVTSGPFTNKNILGGWVEFDLSQGGTQKVDFYNKIETTTTTELSDETITLGESVTDTITIDTTAMDGLPTATGTWTLKASTNPSMTGATTIGSGTVNQLLPFIVDVVWTPPSAGDWWFQASYSGDDSYTGSQSVPADEHLVVNKAPTTTATELSDTTITIGESVTDTITISTTATGTLPAATGTWTLKVADNVGMSGAITIGSGSVSGSLPFTTSVTWTPPTAGTYYFQAFYSGDSNYEGSESVPADEELVVQKAPTNTATELSDTTITIGESVTDTITISTTATGTLPAATGTWTLKVADNVGMTGAITIGSGSVSGSLPFTTSVTWTPPAAGTYYFQASYSGDDNYLPSQSDPIDEELVVEKAPTTTATELSYSSIVLGSSVTDTITISTSATGTLPAATGTWTLKVADNVAMTGATTIGSGSVSGSLPFTTSVTWTPPAAGTYYFQASYSGDSNYLSSQSTPADEELVVQKAPTNTATELSDTTITLGGSVTDTITISTTATGTLPAATGTWTLKVADNVGMTGATTIGSGSVSGLLPFSTSVTWTPSTAGTYYFQASYSGDGNYLSSQSVPAEEKLVVEKAPTTTATELSDTTITTGLSVTDTITISTSATGTLPAATGTWTLKVADNVAMTGAITIGSGSVSGSLPFTTSVTWTPPAAGTYYFQASYTGDSNYLPSQSLPADEELVVVSPYTGTIGYWANHPCAWEGTGISPDDPFPWTAGDLAGATWMEVLQSSPKGDATIQLARQYIGAKLNSIKFGPVPTDIADAIADAEEFLALHPAGSNPGDPFESQATSLANILEAYNRSGIEPGPC